MSKEVGMKKGASAKAKKMAEKKMAEVRERIGLLS